MRYPTSSSNQWLNSIDRWKKVEKALEKQTHDGIQIDVGDNPRDIRRGLYDVRVEDRLLDQPSNNGKDIGLSGHMDADAARQMGVPDYLTEFDALVLPGDERPDKMYMAEITRETDYADRFTPADRENLRLGKAILRKRPPEFEPGLKTMAYLPNSQRMGISDDILGDIS
jgi:hypothetical protein